MDWLTATRQTNYVDGVTSASNANNSNRQLLQVPPPLLMTLILQQVVRLYQMLAVKLQFPLLRTTELGYLDGVTSAIQTQIDGKQALLQVLLPPLTMQILLRVEFLCLMQVVRLQYLRTTTTAAW